MIREAFALVLTVIPQPQPAVLEGVATWYDDGPGRYAAAGSELRRFLGPGWRGDMVRVCRGGACVRVRITDWCGCPGRRVIDLSPAAFVRLGPLSRGVLRISIDEPRHVRGQSAGEQTEG